jgi:hypothetical protein
MTLFSVDKVREALVALTEVQQQIGDDLCGEVREFHVPRVNAAWVLLCQAFPNEAVEAMQLAKDPYGNLLMGDDE